MNTYLTESNMAPVAPTTSRLCFLFLWIFLLAATPAVAVELDIMLVYDRTATSWVEANGGMDLFSQDAVNRMNQVMRNSEIEHRFRVAHSMSVDYSTVSLETDLNALRSASGPFAAVRAARNTYAADIVALLVDTGQAWGRTAIADGISSWHGDPESAISVCSIRAVEISHVLTHEVGHNLGAGHAKSQVSEPGPNAHLDNQYSAGWYFNGSNGRSYHTVMAYNNDGRGNYYAQAPLFSSPLLTYEGGIAGDPLDGDNRRLLNKTSPTVAAYRGGRADMSLIPILQRLLFRE